MSSKKAPSTYSESARSVTVLDECEVLVAGGGVAGIAAAIAAARGGADTMIVDPHGYFGGTATAGGVCNFAAYLPELLGSVAREIIEQLQKRNAIMSIRNNVLNGYISFYDAEVLKQVLQGMVLNAGVRPLLRCSVSSAIVEKGSLCGVVLETKGGRKALWTRVAVDATGDGDLAALAGAQFMKGRESDGKTQAMTLTFTMGGVDTDTLLDYVEQHSEEFRELNFDRTTHPPMISIGGFGSIIEAARRNGELPVDHEIMWIGSLPRPHEVYLNWTHVVNVDGLDPHDLSRAELEARRQVADSIPFFNRRLPGFERAYILSTSHEIGVRETRRIQGRYILTQKDVVEGTKFADVIARNNAPIDIHSPNDDKQTWHAAKTYQIPYRALVPKSPEQLLVAGRCISATHEAIGSVRFEPCCMNTGQASGAAAALAVKTDRSPATLDISTLQAILRAEKLIE
jgi:ribulose 1,5-bisphosphate synthetase/thiazole synthase